MRHRRTVRGFFSAILAAAAIALVSGCGTPLPRYVPAPIESYPERVSRDGLVFVARAVVAADELVKYFGFDLLRYEVLPVLILVKNESARASFLLEADAYTLSAGSGRASSEQLPSPSARMWAGGGGLLGGTMAAEAMNARASVSIAAMRTYTVSPGRGINGFVFFSLPAPEKRQALSVRARAVDLTTDRIVNVDLPIGAVKR